MWYSHASTTQCGFTGWKLDPLTENDVVHAVTIPMLILCQLDVFAADEALILKLLQ